VSENLCPRSVDMVSKAVSWMLFVVATVLVCVQYAYLFRAAMLPFPGNGNAIPLLECVQSGKGGKPPGSSRDCTSGQGSECTKKQPCTPCDADNGCIGCAGSQAAYQAGTAQTGECFFTPELGPYCLDQLTGIVGACTKCCSG
jgi:hypothetical protein